MDSWNTGLHRKKRTVVVLIESAACKVCKDAWSIGLHRKKRTVVVLEQNAAQIGERTVGCPILAFWYACKIVAAWIKGQPEVFSEAKDLGMQ